VLSRAACESVRGRHHRRRWSWAAVVATAALLLGSSSATAADSRSAAPAVSYVALGDSYAAGVGTGQSNLSGPPCLRSSLAYPALWAAGHSIRAFTFLACSGAHLKDVRHQQVPLIPADADLITLTAGGNDVGFSIVLATCGLAPTDGVCTAAVRVAEVVAETEVPFELTFTLAAIHHRAPHARIVVVGYPRLYGMGRCPAGSPDAARRATVDAGADLLAGVMARTAAASGAQFVDVRSRFTPHGICPLPGESSWINGPKPTNVAFHPTRVGQSQAYLPALESVTG
jgi:lysophospholipase L1-like esterase